MLGPPCSSVNAFVDERVNIQLGGVMGFTKRR